MGRAMEPVEYKIDSNKMRDPAPQIGTYRKYAVFIQLGIKKEKQALCCQDNQNIARKQAQTGNRITF